MRKAVCYKSPPADAMWHFVCVTIQECATPLSALIHSDEYSTLAKLRCSALAAVALNKRVDWVKQAKSIGLDVNDDYATADMRMRQVKRTLHDMEVEVHDMEVEDS